MCVCVCTHGVHARLCVYVYVIVAWPIGGILSIQKNYVLQIIWFTVIFGIAW